MSFRHPWPSAYPKLPDKDPETVRLTVCVPKTDANEIVKVSLSPYILNTICQYALKRTAETAKNLSHADQRAFIKWVCNRAFSEFAKETTESNVGGGVTTVRSGVETTQAAAAKSGTKAKKGTSGGGRG